MKISKKTVICFLIILLGLILRLLALNQSFWLDEAITDKVANFSLEEIFVFLKNDFNPPLYYIVVKTWAGFFGNSEISLRIPSVIFSLFSISLTYQLARIWLNDKAKSVAVLLATSPLHIYYSQEARAYSLVCFLVLLTLSLFQKSLSRPKFWFLFSISLAAMVFSHYQTILFLPVLPVFLLTVKDISPTNKRKNWRRLFLACLPLLIIFIFYWPLFQDQLSSGRQIGEGWTNVIGKLSSKNIGLLLVKFIIGRISIENKIIYGILSAILVVIFWGLAFLGASSSLYSLSLFLPIILGIFVGIFLPIFSYFRFSYLLPFFYILIVKGINKLPSRKIAAILFILIITTNLLCSFTYLLNSRFHRENWRLVVTILEKNYPQSPVFILDKTNTAFLYYNRGRLKLIKADSFNRYDQVNLISYGLPIFDPKDKIRTRLKSSGFRLVWGDSFNSVGIERWKK